jgi:CRP-like cAMP-binding protein
MGRRHVVTRELRAIPTFATCSERELRVVSRLATQVETAAGTVLARQGRPGHEFVIVLDGSASVTVDGVHVATLGPGDHFGEIALLDDGPRTATVLAETPMVLAVVDRRGFTALLAEVPTLARTVLVGLARRVRSIDERDVRSVA